MADKKIRQHFDRVLAEGDEMAWLLMISMINRHYHDQFDHIEKGVNALDALPEHNDVKPGLVEHGQRLHQKYKELLPCLVDHAKAHEDLAELYFRYDALMFKHRELISELEHKKYTLRNPSIEPDKY